MIIVITILVLMPEVLNIVIFKGIWRCLEKERRREGDKETRGNIRSVSDRLSVF